MVEVHSKGRTCIEATCWPSFCEKRLEWVQWVSIVVIIVSHESRVVYTQAEFPPGYHDNDLYFNSPHKSQHSSLMPRKASDYSSRGKHVYPFSSTA